jgi:valyl-tRNA synthetase
VAVAVAVAAGDHGSPTYASTLHRLSSASLTRPSGWNTFRLWRLASNPPTREADLSVSEPLSPRLEPGAIEPPLYARALAHGIFHRSAESVQAEGIEPYVIVIPPPNVTAVLHMGHGLNNTVQDVLIRWRRMEGRGVVWVPGTDHAGIATQNVVERKLAKEEGKTRFDVGREPFVAQVWDFVGETGGTILDQLKAIGSSCDWDRTRFTLDPELSRAVREVFVRLYEKGLIYRGEYIINWCPRCGTALSNEEAEGVETDGRLHHLRYPFPEAHWPAAAAAAEAGATAIVPLEGGGWALTVSTTRPETMLGDTGVAVHPEDPRYAGLIGTEVNLPLTGRRIPVVGDDWVDREFGTGMVKVTPAHDPNDFEIARRTGLEILNIMTPEGNIHEDAPEAFRGMDRFEARKAVIRALEAEGFFAGAEVHRHTVPHCYRCDTVVEPRLSDQWFVRMRPLAEPALEASRNGTVRFHPERWTRTYEEWLENIRDWCISRQLWWGHRIPVWTCQGCGEVMCLREDPTACTACGSTALEQDPDVLDTWFSSWLWPFSVFGWPEETEDLKTFYPGHTLVTAPEILFFWVARMIMAGYEFMGEAPFTDVFLHGTVRDAAGRKMSKSLGNGIDPLEVVDRFGADALRYTVLSMCGVGTDIHLDHEDLEAAFSPGRNFANKLWNAGRFTLMSVGEDPVRSLSDVEEALTVADRWILSRLNRTIQSMTDGLERFRLHEVVDRAHHFFWGDFADWYLEIVKGRLRGGEGDESREAARTVLVHTFDQTLRLLHPLVPFVTEALWDRIPWPEGVERPEALPVASWPQFDAARVNPEAERDLEDIQELITTVRSLRKEYGVGEGAKVEIVLSGANPAFQTLVAAEEGRLGQFARVSAVRFQGGESGQDAPAAGASAVLRSGAELFLPLAGLIDLDRERSRLSAEVLRLSQQLTAAEARLSNPTFTDRAPQDIIAKERDKAERFRDQRDKLEAKLRTLGGEPS